MNENFIDLCIYTIFLNKKPDFQGLFVHILNNFLCLSRKPKGNISWGWTNVFTLFLSFGKDKDITKILDLLYFH